MCVCVSIKKRENEVLAADLKRVRVSDMAVASAVIPRKLQRNPATREGFITALGQYSTSVFWAVTSYFQL